MDMPWRVKCFQKGTVMTGLIALVVAAVGIVFGIVVGIIIGKKTVDYNNKQKAVQ